MVEQLWTHNDNVVSSMLVIRRCQIQKLGMIYIPTYIFDLKIFILYEKEWIKKILFLSKYYKQNFYRKQLNN